MKLFFSGYTEDKQNFSNWFTFFCQTIDMVDFFLVECGKYNNIFYFEIKFRKFLKGRHRVLQHIWIQWAFLTKNATFSLENHCFQSKSYPIYRLEVLYSNDGICADVIQLLFYEYRQRNDLQQKLHVYLFETILSPLRTSNANKYNNTTVRSYWVWYQIISVRKTSTVCCSPFQAILQIQPYRLFPRLDKMLPFAMWKNGLIFDSVEAKIRLLISNFIVPADFIILFCFTVFNCTQWKCHSSRVPINRRYNLSP